MNRDFLLLLLAVYTDASSFINNPGQVFVPDLYFDYFPIWNITAEYEVTRNCTKPECYYDTGSFPCSEVVENCTVKESYDRCELTNNPQDMFFVEGLSIFKGYCNSMGCSKPYPGNRCLAAGISVTVGVRCWSSKDAEAENVTATFNVTSVSNPSFYFNNPCNVRVPDTHDGNYMVWNISIKYEELRNWTEPNAGERECPKEVTYDICILLDNPQNMFFVELEGLSLMKKPCTTQDCGNTCPGPSCLAPGSEVMVRVKCGSTKCLALGSITATVNVTSVQGYPVSNCDKLVISNGSISSDNVTNGTQVIVSCDEGLKMIGASTLICINGSWNENPPLCLTECINNTFGENCTAVCDCVTDHTVIPNQACDPDTGVCRCLPTWEGSKCEIDVDECANETHNCDITMSSCSNVPGGFTCQHFIDPTEGSFALIIGVCAGLIVILLVLFVLLLVYGRRLKRKRSDKSGKTPVSLADIMQDKSKHDNEYVSEVSGYQEVCWDNSLYINVSPSATPGPSKEVDWEKEDLTYL